MLGLRSLPSSASTRTFAEDIYLMYRAPISFRGPAMASARLAGERVFVAEVPLSPEQPLQQSLVVLVDSSQSMEEKLPRVR